MKRFRPHIVHILILTLVATILALPSNADEPKPAPKVVPFRLSPEPTMPPRPPRIDPNDPDVIQLAPGYPNSVRNPIPAKGPRTALPHIAFTYSHTRYFGIFIESAGCCSLRANVIVYRKYTTLASAIWWGPCYKPGALFQFPCIYMLQGGLSALHSILAQGEPQIPTETKWCWQDVCIGVKGRALWHNAVYHRDDDLTEAMAQADYPPGLYGVGEHHYCLTLSVNMVAQVNWTYRKYSVDGCKAGY